jgi:hypothetical protein
VLITEYLQSNNKQIIDLSQEKYFEADTRNMQVQFCLKMKDALIQSTSVDYLELEWQEELSPKDLADCFNQWIGDHTFIQRRLPDLQQAEYCQLFINPL